ncbi:MAG: tol-pal system protein YbgF, partial [Pseudomonadota bacterium]
PSYDSFEPPPDESAVGSSGSDVPVTSQAGGTSQSKEAYQNAYTTLQTGRYTDAIGLFNSFLATYPDDRYSDNAQYWLGEAYYVTRDFGAARESFAKVIERFPKSPKVPDAMLKIGYIEYEQGHWEEARRALSDIIKDYPDSTAASLAEKRLVRMNQERR